MKFWPICILVLTSFGCALVDDDAPTAAYIMLENPSLTTTTPQGDPVQNIESAWVYVNGFLNGVYPLPAKVPILIDGEEETASIQISGGVQQNGNIEALVEYPFFNRAEQPNFLLKKGQTLSYPMAFTYKNINVFDFVTGFESNNIFQVDQDTDGVSKAEIVTDVKSTGQKSMLLSVNVDHPINEVSATYFTPTSSIKQGSKIYLEFDYKSDDILFAGLITESGSAQTETYKIFFKPSSVWNRAYIDITDELYQNGVTGFKPAFAVSFESKDNLESKVYIDNVRIVHF